MLAFLLLFVTLGRTYREMFRQPESRALLILSTALVLLGVSFYHWAEGWSFLDALYFCVVTLGTVGYGDITPTTDGGKVFTIFYILVGLSIIGAFFATAGKLIHPGRFLSTEEAKLKTGLPQGTEHDDRSTGAEKAE